ncbi:MAG: beta-ketoacyl-ACP synthase II [Chlamydiia bacterium]|nr:beta-ketoacyl-ACP synthase II [Chlamydiia bacterium]
MSRKRIVVTGLGVVSCFGNDVDTFYSSLLKGQSGVKKITAFSCDDLPSKIAATIDTFDVEHYLDKKQARRVDPYIAYAMVAGKKALEMAKIDPEKREERSDRGVLIGSGMGGMGVFTQGVENVKDHGSRKLTPFFIPYILTNMAGALVAKDLGFMGPNYSISTACATGNYAIIAAANHIRNGEANLMLCGGVEAAIIPMGVAGFCALKALSTRNEAPEKASRPWDKGRDGFVMGEGAGVLVLEELESALQRGAPILAEYLGGGVSCDAYHMTEPRADGLGVAESMERAVKDAGISVDRINYVNAHATSTPVGDPAEVNAMKRVFTQPENVMMNATKSMIGHSLGAASGIEAVVTVKAVQTGKIHPTINLENPEEDIPFLMPKEAVEREIDVALSNSFGFGGHNSSVLFAHYRS